MSINTCVFNELREQMHFLTLFFIFFLIFLFFFIIINACICTCMHAYIWESIMKIGGRVFGKKFINKFYLSIFNNIILLKMSREWNCALNFKAFSLNSEVVENDGLLQMFPSMWNSILWPLNSKVDWNCWKISMRVNF